MALSSIMNHGTMVMMMMMISKSVENMIPGMLLCDYYMYLPRIRSLKLRFSII
jgi:hypothetical protein